MARRPLALMPNAHEGYVSWEKAETIRNMVSSNLPTSHHHGTPKHGPSAGRPAPLPPLRAQADAARLGAKHHIPRYSCSRGWIDNGEPRCIAFGGLRVDDAIEETILAVVSPSGGIKCAKRPSVISKRHDTRANRAFRQYDATDLAN